MTTGTLYATKNARGMLPRGLIEWISIPMKPVNLKNGAKLEKSLYGSTLQERSQVIRFLSFTNHEIASNAFAVITAAKTNASQEDYEDKVIKCIACIALLEQQLSQHDFLISDQITIAGLYAASLFGTLLALVLGKDKMDGFCLLGKWLPKVLQHPALKNRVDTSSFLERTIAPSAAK
ncbi:LAQU0S46e00144g1_1 [Lachancea quebecensis]|uniref:LAQU0S46e00144g1_1 n=1 Tax=Lachancea quebecensis TaxID=1654605 RepID=A0A0N7MMI7_9SACH|nr:LAQU0S46e00144g1_1 [Lachancea quebecensis]